jgi:hypothetical protein
VAELIKNPHKYGQTITFIANEPKLESVYVYSQLDLSLISQWTGLSLDKQILVYINIIKFQYISFRCLSKYECCTNSSNENLSSKLYIHETTKFRHNYIQ